MALDTSSLVAAALGKLGAVAAGQAPLAEDVAAVTPSVTTVLDALFARGIYGPVDPSDIPSEAFPDLAKLVAEENAPDFGRQSDVQAIEYCERRLRRLRRTFYSSQPARPDYF